MIAPEPLDLLAKKLTLIADMGTALRASGVSSVDIDGDRVSIRLAPPYGPPETPVAVIGKPDKEPAVEPEIDALDDPDSYVDGVVPGYEMDEEPA